MPSARQTKVAIQPVNLPTAMVQRSRDPFVCTDNKVDQLKLIKCNKMPPDTSRPQSGGRVDGRLYCTHAESPASKVRSAASLVLSAIYVLLPSRYGCTKTKQNAHKS